MDVLEAGTTQQAAVRRCHVWCWSNEPSLAEWKNRTLVVGGFSFVGLVVGAVTAMLSAMGNRRRRETAVRTAAEPGWRYVTSGTGQVADGCLYIRDGRGAVFTFDLRSSSLLDSPQLGWLRFQVPGAATWWAVEVK